LADYGAFETDPSKKGFANLASSSGGSVFCFSFFYFFLVKLGMQDRVSPAFVHAASLPSIDYMKIGKGSFATSSKEVGPEFEPLINELVIIGKNTRPDSGALSMLSLGFKTSGQQQQIVSGQKIFLAAVENSYQFTDEKTELSILPLPMEGSDVLVQIEMDGKKERSGFEGFASFCTIFGARELRSVP
jgi:hypothetical protein